MSVILHALWTLIQGVALTVFAIFAVIAALGVMRRARCGSCGLPQPIVRRPLNERQALWGGYTCRRCGTELDSSGAPIRD